MKAQIGPRLPRILMSREMTAEELARDEWPVEGGLEGFDTTDKKSLKRFAARRKRHERAQKLKKLKVSTAHGRPPSAAIFPKIAQNRKMMWVSVKKTKNWFEIRLVALLKGVGARTPENLNETQGILEMRFGRKSLKCIGCSTLSSAFKIVARGKNQVRVESPNDPDFKCSIHKEQVQELLM